MDRSKIREILGTGLRWLGDFTSREWLSVFIWSGFGVLAAALFRLALWDEAFERFLGSKYVPTEKVFDDPHLYVPYLTTVAVAIILATALRIPSFFWRYLRSWWAGVTSGLPLLSSVAGFVGFTFGFSSVPHRLLFITTALASSFLLGFALYVRAQIHAGDVPSEDDLRVSPHKRSIAATKWLESDDPIRTWKEDALGRAALVDSISIKLMISESPVLALFGELGSGKTSTLNLLREHLRDRAIVVSFSTWLPGSQETFTTYLLRDIANECNKHYAVPGLRKSAKRLSRALGKNVPLLKSYFESLPEPTQRDDIESLYSALERLPKRVIVLLDELDRMEKEELISLLKVIRGVSHLPNLSFVCAGDFETIVRTARDGFSEEDRNYFEKFFFDVVDIPQLDAAAIKKAGTDRLVATLNRRNWFKSPKEEEDFRKQIGDVWDKRIAPFCCNLRAVGLLANSVGAAAAPLIGEVDPVDLTLLELLRRFKPQLYSLVAKNTVVLTGGPGALRGGTFYTEEQKEALKKSFLGEIQRAVQNNEELRDVKGVLRELFPLFRELDSDSLESRLEAFARQDEDDKEKSKRIQNPEIFPAYFRYELPETMFSSVKLSEFLQRMKDAAKQGDSERVFRATLDSMEKGSPQRDDFLRKLAQAAQKSIPPETGKVLALAAMKAANKYTYDIMPAFGEAGNVLRIALRVAQRLQLSERINFLGECILAATDDTMAYNILTQLTGKHDSFDLQLSLSQLYPFFIKRMRKRYGRDVDAPNMDLNDADPFAFNFWGLDPNPHGVDTDPEDKTIQRDFWLRRIGNSRARLAQDFRRFLLPPNVSYTGDVGPFVENKIPLADLKNRYEQLPDDGSLTQEERQALNTLQRVLNGDFRNGAEPGFYRDEGATSAYQGA